MGNEYINRNRLLRHLADWWLTESPTGNEILFINGEPQTTPVMKVIKECMKAVEEQPTADVVEVVHGEWEDNTGPLDSARQYKCSICGKAPIFSYTWTNILSNYCPNCGAKMDGKKVE